MTIEEAAQNSVLLLEQLARFKSEYDYFETVVRDSDLTTSAKSHILLEYKQVISQFVPIYKQVLQVYIDLLNELNNE